ncbi:MAG TPA: methylamine dehydrogenase accessory protein MauD [Stellaceae bacterium]|nr:methylamine dehydrogenase accessory protein MauD [Stellaceae bacterium]
MTLLAISNAILWATVLALVLVVLALARQIGVLYERVAPLGALSIDAGPVVGEPSPGFDLTSTDGSPVRIGGERPRATLLFFLSPVCPVCRKLLPILKSLAAAERAWLDLVLAGDGAASEHVAYVARHGLAGFPLVLSAELGLRFRVGKLPHAVLIDPDGTIRAKGLVNNREQLESLFTARELGVASVQDFLAAR